MLVLRIGLALGAAAFLGVALLSWHEGFAPDVALLRGLAGFVAIAVLGYAGELVVATAPLPTAASDAAAAQSAEPRAIRATVVPADPAGVSAAVIDNQISTTATTRPAETALQAA